MCHKVVKLEVGQVSRSCEKYTKLEGARESAYLGQCRSFHRRVPLFLPLVYDMWRWW